MIAAKYTRTAAAHTVRARTVMRLRGSAVIVGSVGPAATRMVAGMRYPDRAP